MGRIYGRLYRDHLSFWEGLRHGGYAALADMARCFDQAKQMEDVLGMVPGTIADWMNDPNRSPQDHFLVAAERWMTFHVSAPPAAADLSAEAVFDKEVAQKFTIRREGKPKVVVSLDLDEAELLDDGIVDLLCWVRGFCAARPDDPNGPLGQERVQDLRLKLKWAINQATGGE